MSAITITPVALRADEFAAGWTNVARAEQTDPDDHLHRTMIVEVYERRGVRIIGTNGYLMLWSWVPVAQDLGDNEIVEPAPPLDEEPDMTLWVRDRNHLFHQACKGIARQARKTQNMKVVLSVGVLEDEAQPTLDPDLDAIGLILAARDQRELAPLVMGVTPPEWRRTLDDFDPATVDVTAFSIDTLKRIGGLTNALGYVRLIHQGPDRPILLHADTVPPVDGLMVPVKLGARVPHDEEAWADDAIAEINRREGYQPSSSPLTDGDDDDLAAMEDLAASDATQALSAELGDPLDQLSDEALQALAKAADAIAREKDLQGYQDPDDDEWDNDPRNDTP